jgi:hypothetical protein
MRVAINESTLTAIGDAIREKTDTTDLLAPGAMPAAIRSITTGTGEGFDGTIVFENQTGKYMFAYGAGDKFIEQYGDQVSMSNITDASYMFYDTEITNIPFTIGLNTDNLANMFERSKKLITSPKIELTTDKNTLDMNYMFDQCKDLREVDLSFIPDHITGINQVRIFRACRSLRNISHLEKLKALYVYPSGVSQYSDMFLRCESLDRITNFYPEETNSIGMYTDTTFKGCGRIDNLTFAMNGTTPYIRPWKGVDIDLRYSGYVISETSELDPFPISAEKRVVNDEDYNALKNDPDWWTSDPKYSRYNHDSAVNTINSLPDTSAYLAEKGGTNHIIFKMGAGSATDAGAAGNLTSAEAAVAAAKGWTITIVA